MDQNELKATDLSKLKRSELLEIMLAQSEEIDSLRAQLAERDEELKNRQIAVSQAGSIAEASLKLTNIFEEAQKAANLYVDNVRAQAGEGDASRQATSQVRREAQAQPQAELRAQGASQPHPAPATNCARILRQVPAVPQTSVVQPAQRPERQQRAAAAAAPESDAPYYPQAYPEPSRTQRPLSTVPAVTQRPARHARHMRARA